MRPNPKKSFVSCLLLIAVLYLLLLTWILQGFVGSIFSIDFFEWDDPRFDPISFLYYVTTIVTAAWIWGIYSITIEGRDSEARVYGFFGIVFITPHVAVLLLSGLNWIQSIFL